MGENLEGENMKQKFLIAFIACLTFSILAFIFMPSITKLAIKEKHTVLANPKEDDLSLEEEQMREWHIKKLKQMVREELNTNSSTSSNTNSKDNTNTNSNKNSSANGSTNSKSNANTITEINDYEADNKVKIPVLMYHSIEYEKGNELRVPKETFEKHMQWLHEKGFYTLTMKEYYKAITTGKQVPKKSILITFDDGYKDNYTNGLPIMKRYKMKGTIFVITSTIDKSKPFITSEEIKEFYNNNFDIESHTVNHRELNLMTYEEQLKELKESKETLDKLLNKETIAICYPVGRYNEDTLRACKEAGYKVAFTTAPGFSNVDQGLYKLKRVRINASTTVEQLELILGNYQ